MYLTRFAKMCIVCAVHFSPPHDGHNNRLIVHAITIAKSLKVCFNEAPFFSLSVSIGVGWSINGPSCQVKQTAGRKLPHNWLMRLGVDLAAFCHIWAGNSLN